jgi:hypothetical protein
VKVPKGGRPYPKIVVEFRLVPKYTIFYFVTSRRVVEDDATEIVRARVQHLIEHFKRWKDSEKVFVNLLSVLENVFAQHDDIIYVRAKVWRQVHAVLHRQHEKDFPVSAVHEALSDARVLHKLLVVHAVVQKYERPRVWFVLTHESLLPSQDPFDGVSIVIAVDEQVRHKLFVVVIPVLRGRHDYPRRDVSLVVQNVSHENRLAGVSLSAMVAGLNFLSCSLPLITLCTGKYFYDFALDT